jgi:hypothetical protein
MAGITQSFSGIPINTNGLNYPVKMQRLAEWI